MVRYRALWLWCSLCLALACKPRVGSSCEKGDARCIDETRQLVCQDGKYIEAPCRGPGGCRKEAAGVSCDISANRVGDACSTDEQGAAVCRDGQTLLTCRSGQFVDVICRGPNGCERQGAHTHCDRSLAALGDACEKEGDKACATDSREVLACRDGKMQEHLRCRGPRGCAAFGSKLDCDFSIAAEHDACETKLEGHFACTPDGDALVRCQNARFVLDERCKAGTRCVTQGTSTQCAK